MPYIEINGQYIFVVPPHLRTAAVEKHLDLLMKAQQVGAGAMYGKSNTDQERVFWRYYQDIVQHEEWWFEHIFCRAAGSEFSEWTCGILGLLATIRRQRGDVKTCLEILVPYERVLHVYDELVDHRDADAERCFRNLRYKFHLIATNANQETKQKDACLRSFRAAVEYEIEERYTFDQQQLAWFLQSRVPDANYMTKRFLRDTTDDFIWSQLMAATAHSALAAGPKKSALRVDPWICDCCGEKEEMCGDFMRCTACKKAFYCNRDCQVKHWKLHKPDCKKTAPRTKVAMETMKGAAKETVEHYAEASAEYARKEVSESHQKEAFPGTVQVFKKFLVDNRQYDSEAGFQDVAGIEELRGKLDAFVAALPGFEALSDVLKQSDYIEANKARWRSAAADGEIFDSAAVANFATHAMAIPQTTLHLPEEKLKRATESIAAAVTTYLLEHPKYNSHRGLERARKNADFQLGIEEAIGAAVAD